MCSLLWNSALSHYDEFNERIFALKEKMWQGRCGSTQGGGFTHEFGGRRVCASTLQTILGLHAFYYPIEPVIVFNV